MNKQFLRRAVLATAIAAIPFIATGQQQVMEQPVQPRGGLNPDSFYGKETFQGVSVRDSLEAIKKLEDARRMERLNDWNKAADWYQEVIEKYGDRVVPSGTDANKNISQYTGIERPVQEQLAKWPKEGLTAYQNRFGGIAKGMLEQARRDDIGTLSKVMKLYFVTEAGKQAAIRIVDLMLEDGQFAAAAHLADRLITWHPSVVVERPKVLFRSALAYHLSGDKARAVARLDELKSKYGDATGTIFGKDIVLADAIQELVKVAPPQAVATSNASFRNNPGGNDERSMVLAVKGRTGARMVTVEYAAAPAPRNMTPAQLQQMEAINVRQAVPGPGLGVMPVIDNGEMFFQDGLRVYAVSLQSGVPLPGWIQSYPNNNGQYAVSSTGTGRAAQHTLTLTDNSLLGVMGNSERVNAYYGGVQPVTERGTRLVCLDRSSGREKWVAYPKRIPEGNLQSLDFSGSPLVVGENVYILGRGGKNYTSEDCYVICYDLNNGNYKWSCFIASASNANAYTGVSMTGETLSHMAHSSGRIFVLTNLGALAALDAYSGTVAWLNIYPRDGSNMGEAGWQGRVGRSTSSNVRSWEFNPVFVQEGKVFIHPTDANHFLVYDAGTGQELKRIAVADFRKPDTDITGPEALLAIDGKQAIFSSKRNVYAIDWTRPSDDCVLWISDLPRDVQGRGFVTADSVFFCTESSLHRIERFSPETGKTTGRIKDTYPAQGRPWDEGEGPGNVLVTADQVIVAGQKRLNIYADMVLARKRLDEDVAAAPGDPEPRLRYAEVMFVAGQLPVSMEKLDEAVKLLGGLGSLRSGPERDHLFNDCITFAIKLQKDKKRDNIEETLDAVNKLYELAAGAADGDSQQVNYRMSRSKFNRDFRQEGSLENAIKLYQEILTTPRLRTVPLQDDDGSGATQAANAAEKAIGEVKKLRAVAYEPFEKLATDALAAAGKDPALLKAVAEFYPNSDSAAKAMMGAAEAYEAAGNHKMATHTLRNVYAKYGDSTDKALLLEAMARNYLAVPDRVDVTAARLSTIVKLGQGANLISQPLKLPDGKVLIDKGVSFNQALKTIQNFRSDAVSARLPDFKIPPPISGVQKAEIERKWRKAGADPAKKPSFKPKPFASLTPPELVGDIAALIGPPRELRQQHSRPDRVVAFSNGNLVIFPIGAKEPAGRASVTTEAPKSLAWLSNDSVLVWNDAEVALADGKSADRKWKLDLKSLPRIEVIAGGKPEEAAQPQANNNDVMAEEILLGGGRVVRAGGAVRVINGRVIRGGVGVPQPQIGGAEQISWVKPMDDRIVVATSAGQLFAIKTADGTLAWHTRLANNAQIDRLCVTDDFTVAKLTDAATTQIVILDTLEGKLSRRISFNNDTGQIPVNIALAPDGMLVWIQPDRICGKDLFEPRKDVNYEIVSGQTDARGANVAMDGQPYMPVFAGSVQPDQFLVSEGRVMVVSHQGQFVSIHSLETGRLLDYQQADGRRAEMRLPTYPGESPLSVRVTDWSASLNVIGSMLYVTTRQNGPMAYNLDKMNNWAGTVSPDQAPSNMYRDPMIGQDYFVVLDVPTRKGPPVGAVPNPNINVPQPVNVAQPAAPAAAPAANTAVTNFRMHLYSRSKVKETANEIGVIYAFPDIRNEAGITSFEPVDGGFYYLTADKKLYFLKGSHK